MTRPRPSAHVPRRCRRPRGWALLLAALLPASSPAGVFATEVATGAGADRAVGALAPLAPAADAVPVPAEPDAAARASDGDGDASADGSRFLLLPYPITEPAIGNGLFAGPVWMREGPRVDDGPPQTEATGFGALWTDGGSRGAAGFDRRAWADGRWWSTAIAVDADLVLRYDGLRPDGGQDLGFTLGVAGLSVEAVHRFAGRPDSLGLRVFASRVRLDFDAALPPELGPDLAQERANGLVLSYERDSRDQVYSPTRGQRLQATLTAYAPWLGASFEARGLGLRWTRYGRGLGDGVLGLRVSADASRGDPPFYLRPYVALRGVPALRYAGEDVYAAELEHRWPVGERWDLIAFGGAGHARSRRDGARGSASVGAGGLGVRFKARKYFGMTFGVDVAHGPDGVATYVQIGNAWSR